MSNPTIQAWTRRTCKKCRRERTHYKHQGRWHCIGTARWASDIVVPCGKRRSKGWWLR